ncbi:addiction module HigA family antidote [Massilia sp. UYP32]|uniref:HigA family addiction module antitoxin n=1 Tax=Massilia TaxID=149698 RepID=UPI0009DA4CBE|nr:HigA family addiction module antitoxin [Massilia timonae]
MFANRMRPVHPGEVLREEYLVPLKMSGDALAVALLVSPAQVNRIRREKSGISPIMALRLSRYFGTTPEFWLNLQMMYELQTAKSLSGESITKMIQPRCSR